MRIAIYGIYQSAMGQKVHLGAVHKKLLDIAVDNHSQLFFRKRGSFTIDSKISKVSWQIFIQRIKGDISILGRAGKLQPSTIVIQFFGNGRG